MRYNRILIKLSGGALAGKTGWGFDPDALNHIADEVLSLRNVGIQVGVVVGGGNIFRGELGEEWLIVLILVRGGVQVYIRYVGLCACS